MCGLIPFHKTELLPLYLCVTQNTLSRSDKSDLGTVREGIPNWTQKIWYLTNSVFQRKILLSFFRKSL